MRALRGWLTAVVLSGAFALAVTLVLRPGMHAEGDRPVWSATAYPVMLTPERLPDLLAGLSLSSRLQSVKWESGSLFVDLAVSEPWTPDEVYADWVALMRRAFLQTTNVQHVYVRVTYAPGNARPALVAALDAERGESGRLARLREASPENYGVLVHELAHVQPGPLWWGR
jgi:hypothetical protein